MKCLTQANAVALLASVFLGQLSWASGADAVSPFKVMLQGKSAAALQQLVENNGGSISHSLHIINAVGAMVTREQLNTILESPLVTRHLDDLSTSGAPEEPEKSCDIGGALELDLKDSQLSWLLYNKKDTSERLRSLELHWPATLGSIESLSLGDTRIDPALYRSAENGKVSLEFTEEQAPTVGKTARLQATFKPSGKAWTDSFPIQRDFQITATFGEDCSTKLIPGYKNNHEDSYFPTVIGAGALHLHQISGKGITVAIIDSGLWEASDLALDTAGKPRILARYDAINDVLGKEAFDESGHGTHIASVIAHSGAVTKNGRPTGTYKGVAPDVNLVVVKAFDVEGHGDFLDIVRAIQFVVDHREALDIKVLNLSFAARPRWHYWLDPINQAAMKAWASGITIVAAAGNEGPDAMTIGSPGNLPYLITVGAVTDSWTVDTRDDDYIPDFSSRGPTPNAHIKPDLVAPGGHMTGITRPGSTLTREHPDYLLKTGEFVMTGTSQASALVTGMVALLLQLEPDLSPDDVKCKLMSSAELAINRDGLLAYSPFQQGSGYASVTRAITLGQRGCGNGGLDIYKDMAGTDHYQGPGIILEDGSTSLPGLGEMYLGEPSQKGLSTTRKWGVKAHIERDNPQQTDNKPSATHPFDWESAYIAEQTRIEELAREPQQ
ncbi:MAG: S8 family peptidase [Proteobacteria bacterium]|nr:S8 family peptidase [Pseudomonadota bacterium]